MKERIIQLRNAEGEPFFIGMDTGKVTWTIPVKSFGNLTHMAHLSDGSACYYEDLRTQGVSWTLPFSEMSSAAINAAKVLQGCNQEDTEEWINSPYPEDESVEVMLGIDAYLLTKEQGEELDEEDEGSDEASLSSAEQTPPAASVSPSSPNVMSGIFSANSSKIFNKDANSDHDEQSGSEEDILPVAGAKAVEENSEDEEDESGSGGTMESDGDDSEDEHDARDGATGSNPAASASLTAAQILSQTTIKASKMTVLAKGTFRNWKERYVVLRAHHIAYYEDQHNLHKAEAEFQINPTVSVKNFDHKGAFGLKISSAQDALSIALATEDERDLWIELVQNIAAKAQESLKASAALLSPEEELLVTSALSPGASASSPSPKKSGWSGKKNKKYFVLSGKLLTMHMDENSTTAIEDIFQLEKGTELQLCDDASRTLVLSQRSASGAEVKHLAVQFSLTAGSLYNLISSQNADQQQYASWKSRLQALLPAPAPAVKAPSDSAKSSTAAPTTPLKGTPARTSSRKESPEESGSESEGSESDNGSHDSGFGHEHAHAHNEVLNRSLDKSLGEIDVGHLSDSHSDADDESSHSSGGKPARPHTSPAAPRTPLTPKTPIDHADAEGFSDSHSDGDDASSTHSGIQNRLQRGASVHELAEADFSDSHSEGDESEHTLSSRGTPTHAVEVAAPLIQREAFAPVPAPAAEKMSAAAAAAVKPAVLKVVESEESAPTIVPAPARPAESKQEVSPPEPDVKRVDLATESFGVEPSEDSQPATSAATTAKDGQQPKVSLLKSKMLAKKAAADAKLKAEKDAAAEAARIVKEQEVLRLAAEKAEADRRAAKVEEEVQRAALEAARLRALEEQAELARREQEAKVEAARVAAENEEAARIAAEKEAVRLAAAEAEAVRIAAEKEAARIAAEKDAARLAAEAEAEAARVAAEREAARIAAEKEAARLAAEAEAARVAAERDATRVAAEKEAARIAAEKEAARLAAAEAEAARIAAEREAARIAAEKEAARLAAEAEAEAARVAAEKEAARIAAEKDAALLAAEAEAARVAAEKEAARLAAEAEAEAARVAAEKEAARIAAEKEAARLAAEAEAEAARIAAEKEAARIAAEKDAALLAAEAEAARVAAEKEAARLAAKAEAARIAAEREATHVAAEKEAARVAAEKEAARLAAEREEAARMAEMARVAAETEAARVAAEKEAARVAAEAEAARLAAEREVARVAAEREAAQAAAAEREEAARIAVQREAARIVAEEEAARVAAETAEAARIAESARIAAEEAEASRRAIEAEAARIQAEEARRAEREAAEQAQRAAEALAARLAAEEAEKAAAAQRKSMVGGTSSFAPSPPPPPPSSLQPETSGAPQKRLSSSAQPVPPPPPPQQAVAPPPPPPQPMAPVAPPPPPQSKAAPLPPPPAVTISSELNETMSSSRGRDLAVQSESAPADSRSSGPQSTSATMSFSASFDLAPASRASVTESTAPAPVAPPSEIVSAGQGPVTMASTANSLPESLPSSRPAESNPTDKVADTKLAPPAPAAPPKMPPSAAVPPPPPVAANIAPRASIPAPPPPQANVAPPLPPAPAAPAAPVAPVAPPAPSAAPTARVNTRAPTPPVVAEEAAPVALTPAMLRKALHAVEIEFQINKADLLQNHYLETRRTPMGRVIFEHYKTSELTISPHSVQALCYDFGVYVSAEEVGEAVKKYASLPGGTMIYQDFLIWWQQHEEISSVKLNDPKFIRQNQAVLCFKKLDPELHGCIPSEALPTLFAILQQNDVIGSKSILATAVLRLDPEQEHVIKLQPFLQWVALEEQPDSKQKTPLQRLFGEVARRSSSAIYTPGRSAIAAAPQPVTAPVESTGLPTALEFKARFVNRAAAVKRFMGGAAIAGVPRTLDAAYTEREDLVPITEGKYGKAFDMELLESLAAPPKAPVIPLSIMDMVVEEELEVWELKTEGKISAPAPSASAGDTKAPANNAMRRRSLLRGAEEVVEPVIPTRLAPAVPTKSAMRSRSSSPSATRRPSGGSTSVRFDERKQEPVPPPQAALVDAPYTHPDLEFFDINSFPKEKEVESPRLPSNPSGGFTEAKTSGVFLNKYSGDEDEAEDEGDEQDDARVLYNEGGEFTQSCIKAAVEEMFSLRSYVSPLKAAQRPPPPPPPPSGLVRGDGEDSADADVGADGAGDFAEDDEGEAGEFPDRPSDATEPEEGAWGKGSQPAVRPAASAYAGNSFLMAEASSDEEEQAPTPAAAAPAPLSLKDRIAALNKANNKQESASGTAPKFEVAAKSPQKGKTAPSQDQDAPESPPAPVPPSNAPPPQQASVKSALVASKPHDEPASSAPPSKSQAAVGPSPSRTVPVARFAAPTFPTMQPLPAIIEFEASLTADQFLSDTTTTISSAVNRIQSFADCSSVKVPAKSPLISELANTTVNRAAIDSSAQHSAHGQLDAFEQLMLERKAVAEALVRLQELEEASLKKIRDAEAASLQRIQSEAEESIVQVKKAEQRLKSKVQAHVEKVQQESSLLSNYRRDLYAKQAETAKIQEQRFEQVAEMATTLAEQQLHIAAERRRVSQRQFQLELSLIDLSQVEASRSKPASPVRGPAGNVLSQSYGMHTAQFSPRGQEVAMGTWGEFGSSGQMYSAPMAPSAAYPTSYNEFRSDFPVGPSRPSAVSQQNPAPMQTSPAPARQSAALSTKSDSPPFEKLPPNWHSPVVPLVARRESAAAVPFPPQAQGAVSPPPPPPSSSPGAFQEEQDAGGRYYQSQRVVSPNADSYDSRVFGYTSTQYPNAVKNAADPNWRRPFR